MCRLCVGGMEKSNIKMCRRDRIKDATGKGISAISGKMKELGTKVVIPVAIAAATATTAVVGASVSEGAKLEPVSYTHLDVYKRQTVQNMIICSRFLSAFLVIIKNTAFLIIPLYQKNGYKCRKARLLLGLCLQSGAPEGVPIKLQKITFKWSLNTF